MENNRNAHAVPSPYYRGLRITDKDHDSVELNNPLFSPNADGFCSRIRIRKLLRLSFASPEETTNDDRFSPSNQQLLSSALHAQEDGTTKHDNPAVIVDIVNIRQPLRALSRNHIQELETDSGDPFAAFIDIWDENDYIVDDATAHQLTHQAWKNHIDKLKRSGLDDSAMKMMSETAAALGGQAIGVVVANALATGRTSTAYCVEFVVMLGLCCTVAGIGLRRKSRALATKVGAVATISAIIISLASHLPPVMTWTVGPLAILVSAFAVALA